MKRKRIITKIGDVFCAVIDDEFKCYFQYIANDLTQLNSSVIRVLKTHYPLDVEPKIQEIIDDEVDFYAHTILRRGIEDGAWYKIGKDRDLSSIDFKEIIFADTESEDAEMINGDIVVKELNPLENWRIWEIGGNMKYVGEPPVREECKVEIVSGVLPYRIIIDRIKYGYWRILNNELNLIKQMPPKGVHSYILKETVDYLMYYDFNGADLNEMFKLAKGESLTLLEHECNIPLKFYELEYRSCRFISEAEFSKARDSYCQNIKKTI